MPIGTILAVAAAYIFVAVLLISLNLTSRWRWWIKGGAIIITTVFFVVAYWSTTNVVGWPTSQRPFDKFLFVSSTMIEPNELAEEPGVIYLWLADLDEFNVPARSPRAFELPYTQALADTIAEVQSQTNDGEEVMGELQAMQDEQEQEEGDEGSQTEGQEGEIPPGQQSGAGASNYELPEYELLFNGLPPVVLPTKSGAI